MSSNVSLCAFCNGPLVVTLGSVTCSYCGKPNQPTGIPSKTQIRQVVREVVTEDLNHNGIPDALEKPVSSRPVVEASQVSARVWALSIGVGVMIMSGVAGFMLFSGGQSRGTMPREIISPPVTPKRVVDNSQPLPEAPPELGVPHAYWMDKSFIYLASDNWIAKVARPSLQLIWKTRRNPGKPYLVRLVADRVFVTSSGAAEFYLAESGVETGTYRYRDSSFPPDAACPVGNHLLISTSFQPQLRLDALTAKKISGKGSCSLNWWRYISCPAGQQCSQRAARRSDLLCHGNLHAQGKDYQVCETDDGSAARSAVIARSGNKSLWTTYLESPLSGEVGFIGIVDGVLVVGSQSTIQALALDTGQPTWSQPGANYRSIVQSDDKLLYFSDAKTFNVVEAASGRVFATLQMPALQAEKALAP
jgi:hypothetical protein